MTESQGPEAVRVAHRLVGTQAARELVPALAGTTARWHRHGYPGPYCRWNYHPEFEVHLIQKGTGRFVVGDHIGPFHPGQLVLVGSNLPHHWISDLGPDETIPDRDVVFQFHPQWMRDCQTLMPELHTLDPLLERAARGIEFAPAIAESAARPLIAIGESEGLDRLGHILALLNQLSAAPTADQQLLANPWIAPPLGDGVSDVVDEVFNYISQAADRPIRMGEIATRVGMSDSAFSRYIKRSAGQSFSDMVRKMRLTQACQLLERTEDPVARIAFSVGYQNLANFNRQFLRQYGLTPTTYRRRQAQHPLVAATNPGHSGDND